MFALCEFELYEDEGMVLAVPFELEGGTEGRTYEEAAAMAADWLKGMAQHGLMAGRGFPAPALGHEPAHGGRVLLVGVDVSLADVPRMTAAEAAARLGVSRARVSQMLGRGQLEGWREGRNTYVTEASVACRLAENPQAGRPRREAAMA